MIFNPVSCTILTIIFFFGFLGGHKYASFIYKMAMEKWTNEIYNQYQKTIKEKNDEIERLKNKKCDCEIPFA